MRGFLPVHLDVARPPQLAERTRFVTNLQFFLADPGEGVPTPDSKKPAVPLRQDLGYRPLELRTLFCRPSVTGWLECSASTPRLTVASVRLRCASSC